jgi:hypothetical protein
MKDSRREISGLLKYNDCLPDFGGGKSPREWGSGLGEGIWGKRGNGLIYAGDIDRGLEDKNYMENIVDVNDEIFVRVTKDLFSEKRKLKSILARGLVGKRFNV